MLTRGVVAGERRADCRTVRLRPPASLATVLVAVCPQSTLREIEGDAAEAFLLVLSDVWLDRPQACAVR